MLLMQSNDHTSKCPSARAQQWGCHSVGLLSSLLRTGWPQRNVDSEIEAIVEHRRERVIRQRPGGQRMVGDLLSALASRSLQRGLRARAIHSQRSGA